jgi:ATP-dependent protease HslVU (ClpYQ) peptidase subunit
MSVVVAFKVDGIVYIGADSQVSGDMKGIHTSPNNFKVKPINGLEYGLVSTVGRTVISNLLRVKNDLVDVKKLKGKTLGYEDVVRDVVPKLIAYHRELGLIAEDEVPASLSISCLIAHRDRLFLIQSNDGGVVFEIEGHCVIGSGSYEAGGSLAATTGLDPVERIVKAISVAKELDRGVDFPIIIRNTGNDQTIVVTEQMEFKTINVEGSKWA